MDSPKPPHRPAHLLDDLESICEFLVGNGSSEPPLLTDSVDPALIPLLSDVVSPGHERPGLDSPGRDSSGLENSRLTSPTSSQSPLASPAPPPALRSAPPAVPVAPSVQRPLASPGEQARPPTPPPGARRPPPCPWHRAYSGPWPPPVNRPACRPSCAPPPS